MTTTQTPATCRCGSVLQLLAGTQSTWINERMDWLCGDGKPHAPKPACPPSEVRDMIVPWLEVYQGDLVLYDGQFCLLENMWPLCSDRLGSEWVGVYLVREGVRFRASVNSDDLTAVRRYDTGEG